ncbi:MAG: ParA family protein [Candidatus Nitrospinota bacterium M3_3B_026]
MTLKTRRIAIFNRKGGSGKTTTAVNLAAALALRGEKTLLVDIDPQANATMALGADADSGYPTIYELLLGMETEPGKVIRGAKPGGLDLIPSAPRLSGAELELAGLPGRELRLKEILDGAAEGFNFVLVDCPVCFGLLALNALVACGEVLIPVQTHYFSVKAVEQALDIIGMVKRELNPNLRVTGLVPTMMDRRARLSRKMLEMVEKEHGRGLVRSMIRMDAKLAEAPAKGKPIQLYAPKSNGAYDYTMLGDDIRVT